MRQGLPTLGTVPGANENPNVHGASVSAAPSKPKARAGGGATSGAQAATEPAAAITFNTIQFTFGSAQITPESA